MGLFPDCQNKNLDLGSRGKYTFILEYYSATAANLMAQFAAEKGITLPPAASDPDDGGPTIFTAIQKQLGLRLNKTADVPVDVIVLEKVDKLPTPN